MPQRLKRQRVRTFKRKEVSRWVAKDLAAGETVTTKVIADGVKGFCSLAQAGFPHDAKILGGGWKSAKHPAFKWVNTRLADFKQMLLGTYRTVQPKHLPRYFAEFQYRFTRHYRLEDMVPRLLYVAIRTPPIPGQLLLKAEFAW